MVEIYYRWRPNLPDEADNHVLELAVAAGGATILTFNRKDFSSGELRFPEVAIQAPASAKPAPTARLAANSARTSARRVPGAGAHSERVAHSCSSTVSVAVLAMASPPGPACDYLTQIRLRPKCSIVAGVDTLPVGSARVC